MSIETEIKLQDDNLTGRFRVLHCDEELADAKFVRGQALPIDTIKLIEDRCRVEVVYTPQDRTYTVVPLFNQYKQDVRPETAKDCIIYALEKRMQLGRLDDGALLKYLSAQSLKEKKGIDGRERAFSRQMRNALGAYNANPLKRAPTIIDTTTHLTNTIIGVDEQHHAAYEQFLKELSTREHQKILAFFHEDPRINARVELEKDPDLKLIARIPTHEDQNDESKLALIKQLLESIANNRRASSQQKLSYDWVAERVDNEFKILKVDRDSQGDKPTKRPNGPRPSVKTVSKAAIVVTDLNGQSLQPLVGHLSNASRSAALVAFKDTMDPALGGVAVTLNSTQTGFTIHLGASADGSIDYSVFNFVCTALADAARVLDAQAVARRQNEYASVQNSSLNKAWFREWIDKNLPVLKESPKTLSPTFRTAVNISQNIERPSSVNNQNSAPVIIVNHTSPRGITEGFNRVAPQLDFDLPEFNDQGAMRLNTPSGKEKLVIPTENQWGMIEGLLNPDKKIILVDGPPGTGKSLFAAWAQLKLLREGLIFQALYERPLSTVGGKQIGFLPGSIDEKVGPHGEAFENVYFLLLGNGDLERGKKLYDRLSAAGRIRRFDGLFQQGVTIYDAMLYVDEAQNKTSDELWNLVTRADEGSRVVLSGDYKTQVNIKGSGLRTCFEMYAGLYEVSIHHLGPEDIKRSPLITKLWERREAYINEHRGDQRDLQGGYN